MDAAPSYHIIFSGKLRAGFEQAQVKAALAVVIQLTGLGPASKRPCLLRLIKFTARAIPALSHPLNRH